MNARAYVNLKGENLFKKYINHVYYISMARAMKSIRVEEVMSKNPKLVSGDLSVREGARILRDLGISTLIIVEDGKPIGIVTDRDFVTKVIAEGLPPDTKLKEIMSSPIIMIPYNEHLSDAAKIMSRRRIRKLPVVKGNEIVGILSENDITRISPDLIALAQEYANIHNNPEGRERTHEYIAGKCEMCGQFSLRLTMHNGMLICPECLDSLQ